jgi:phage/plasmid-like protein (TIGR03299 family)
VGRENRQEKQEKGEEVMSANVQTMAYTGAVPWHGLGKHLENAFTASEAITAAGLDWEVQLRQLFYQVTGGPQDGQALQVPNMATVRVNKDASEVYLGTVGMRYTPLQNKNAFSFFDNIVGEGAAIYHTAGVLGQGERIWLLAKLPTSIKVMDTDNVDKYLCLSNSHDGSSLVKVFFTAIRIVCQNTLNAAIGSAAKIVSIRHTAGLPYKLELAADALGIITGEWDKLEREFQGLADAKITSAVPIKDYLNKLYPDSKYKPLRARNVRQRITSRYINDPTLKGLGHNYWRLWNATTAYIDHDVVYRNGEMGKFESTWFGRGEERKEEAFSLALKMAGVKDATDLEVDHSEDWKNGQQNSV